jgi:hypothetical protein
MEGWGDLMARGSSKSDLKSVARPSLTKMAMRIYLDNKAEFEKNVPGQKNGMSARRDRAVEKNAFLKLAGAIYQYEKYTHFMEDGHKERKQRIVDAMKAMPKEVQDFITEPKDKIKDLTRIGTHASNPDKNGNIAASFTTSDEYANAFEDVILKNSEKFHGRSADYGKKAKTYGAEDIESFEGIISFSKVRQLIAAYEKIDQAKRRKADLSEPGDWISFGSQGFRPRQFEEMNEVDEHLVYGIKWKKGVT